VAVIHCDFRIIIIIRRRRKTRNVYKQWAFKYRSTTPDSL